MFLLYESGVLHTVNVKGMNCVFCLCQVVNTVHLTYTCIMMWAVWLSGDAVALINVVALRRPWLLLSWVTVRGINIVLVCNQAIQANSAWLSLLGYGHRRGRNGELCVSVNRPCYQGTLIYWADLIRRRLLTEPAIRPTWLAWLGLAVDGWKRRRGDELRHNNSGLSGHLLVYTMPWCPGWQG